MADIRLPIVSASGDKCVCSTTCVDAKPPAAFRVAVDWDWGYYPMSMFVAAYYIDTVPYDVTNYHAGWYTAEYGGDDGDTCLYANEFTYVTEYAPIKPLPWSNIIKHYAPSYDTFDIDFAALRKIYPRATHIALRFESGWYPSVTYVEDDVQCWYWGCVEEDLYGNCTDEDYTYDYYKLKSSYITTDNESLANATFYLESYDGVIGAKNTSLLYSADSPLSLGPGWTSGDFFIVVNLANGDFFTT